MLQQLKTSGENLGMTMEFTDEVKDYLAKKRFDEAYGARPYDRAIQTKLEDV